MISDDLLGQGSRREITGILIITAASISSCSCQTAIRQGNVQSAQCCRAVGEDQESELTLRRW